MVHGKLYVSNISGKTYGDYSSRTYMPHELPDIQPTVSQA